jgi:hypothetical protein
MNIEAAFVKVDNVPIIVVKVDPKVVEDRRLSALSRGLLAKCAEMQNSLMVLAALHDENSEPAYSGQPETVRRLQIMGWENLPFEICNISVRA